MWAIPYFKPAAAASHQCFRSVAYGGRINQRVGGCESEKAKSDKDKVNL